MKRRDALLAMLALGAAGPGTARAQPPPRTHRVALFLAGTEAAVARQRALIAERLATHGFAEGGNLRLDVRIGTFNTPLDAGIARALVAAKPDAILVDTSPLAARIREATASVPFVFTGVADPIASGLVKDFARPGGNATGVHFSQLEIAAKRLELLRELLPGARRIMVARMIAGPEWDTLPHLRAVASRLGFDAIEISASWYQGVPLTLWSSAYGKPDAFLSGQPWLIYGMEHTADEMIRFAAEQRIPSMFWEAEMVARGATVAYGVDPVRELGRATDQLARVLKGANPATLPVDQATVYELAISRKSVKALGVTIPPAILARARVVD